MKSAAAAAPSRPSAATGGKCGPVAASKVSRKRGFVLVAIHLAILVHVAQWKITGTTVTPVEPSEAMQTLELGYVNAGFVLFLAALAATAVFGRFFCGWACHVVAYQDACGWLMGKLGVRPRPFRSRLLAYVPLIAGLYMFVWPTLKRHVNMAAATPEPLRRLLDWPKADFWFEAYRKPEFRAAFFTDDFWATFPDFWMATLTVLVCGPLIVWFLGNKGFCTYGCPYGGLFGVADRLAPARIRVTDACEGCGHCTAVCTSNVRVHEEVKLYKAVVDPQCMKCLDCVSVCPKDALYVGFGAPALLTRAAPKKPVRSYDLGFRAEFRAGRRLRRGRLRVPLALRRRPLPAFARPRRADRLRGARRLEHGARTRRDDPERQAPRRPAPDGRGTRLRRRPARVPRFRRARLLRPSGTTSRDAAGSSLTTNSPPRAKPRRPKRGPRSTARTRRSRPPSAPPRAKCGARRCSPAAPRSRARTIPRPRR
jgi:NAD-dependent dihydropyrimidine dehydrogenase PreA subunit